MAQRKVSQQTKAGLVEGVADARFQGVAEAFIANFEERGEVGASCCVQIEGETLVDLWGGRKTIGGDPWTQDTIGIVYSCTKGAMSLCGHMAVDQGRLDLDAPVAKYWPEFAQNGKENAVVSMLFDHSVGLPALRTKLENGDPYNYEKMVGIIEREKPFWEPGTRNGYHAMTLAWTVGEIAHRANRQRTGAFFQEKVAKPLGIEFWIGLPAEYDARVAPMIPAAIDPNAPPSRIAKRIFSDPDSATYHFIMNGGGMDVNTRAGLAAEIGSGNGVTNARGLAGLYAPLANGGAIGGVRLVSQDTITRMSRVSAATHDDATLCIPTRFALGYMKSMDNRALENSESCSVIISEAAFGHVGAGGSFGFADPECKLSFGYTMNKMGQGILLNDRGQSLVDATYRALGYRTNAGGVWTM